MFYAQKFQNKLNVHIVFRRVLPFQHCIWDILNMHIPTLSENPGLMIIFNNTINTVKRFIRTEKL